MLTRVRVWGCKARMLVVVSLATVACKSEELMPAPDSRSATAAKEAAVARETLESTDEFQVKSSDLGPRDQLPGAELYTQYCATCHNGTVAKAPNLFWLEMLPPRALLATMNEGIMRSQAASLSSEQRVQVAEYITSQRIESVAADVKPAYCASEQMTFDEQRTPPQVGWGHDTSRYYPARVGQLSAKDAPSLRLKWAFAFPDAFRARSQPAIAYGAVFVGSQDGTVYALDLETGCARWTFQASAEVRTGVVLTESKDRGRPIAVFGDILAKLYAVDAWTGELVWSRKIDDHPSATLTGTPALLDGRLFVPVSSLEVIAAADPSYPCCTFRGKLVALDIATGEIIWEHYTIPNPPAEVARTSQGTPVLSPSGAPSWTSPAFDRQRNRIYVGTGENYSSPADANSDAIIAIDMTTGERVWTRQSTSGDAWNVACMMEDNPNCPAENGPDFDHGSSVILVTLPNGRQVLTAGHKNGTIFGLDPDNEGAVLWSTRVGRGSIQGGVHFGMAVEGTTVYAPINDMNDTHNGDDLDAKAARPGVHAIDAATGRVLWSHVQTNVCPTSMEFCDPGVSAPVSAIPGAVIAGHLDGWLRVYRKDDGKVLWEYDTTQAVKDVNGRVAKGGSMSGSGAVVADGHVVVNSGYGLYFHAPGNMLAVFSVGGR